MTYVVRPVLEVLIWPLPRFFYWNLELFSQWGIFICFLLFHTPWKTSIFIKLAWKYIQLAEIYLEEFYQTYSIWILLQTICAIASDTFRLIPSLTNFIRKGCNIIDWDKVSADIIHRSISELVNTIFICTLLCVQSRLHMRHYCLRTCGAGSTHVLHCSVLFLHLQSVSCAQCFLYLWIVHSWLPLRFSLMFICRFFFF